MQKLLIAALKSAVRCVRAHGPAPWELYNMERSHAEPVAYRLTAMDKIAKLIYC